MSTHLMTDAKAMNFKPFPLAELKYTTARCKQIVATTTAIARKYRGNPHPREIVQHTLSELVALYEIASGWHNKDVLKGYSLQCGVFAGGSACVIADALRSINTSYTPLIAIDNYTRNYAPMRELFNQVYLECRENIWANDFHHYINLVVADDLDYLKHFLNVPLQFAFIDSSHHYEHTLKELAFIFPHLIRDSWLIFDDYFSEKTPGVKRAVDEFLESKPNTFTAYQAKGLLILQKV